MRYIDISELARKLPNGWQERAGEVLNSVRALAYDQRAAAINQHGDVWSNLKQPLQELSFNKCWYCESIEIRSDNAVDHYRPKSRVNGEPQHHGYWWLAFDWKNYRFSCTFCNSLRKRAGSL